MTEVIYLVVRQIRKESENHKTTQEGKLSGGEVVWFALQRERHTAILFHAVQEDALQT